MKLKRKNTNPVTIIVAMLYAAIIAFVPLHVGAIGINISTCSFPSGPQPYWCSYKDVISFLDRVLDVVFTIFLIVAVIMFIWAAFAYLTAGGEENKIDEAKKRLKWGIVAVVIALLSTSFQFVIDSIL